MVVRRMRVIGNAHLNTAMPRTQSESCRATVMRVALTAKIPLGVVSLMKTPAQVTASLKRRLGAAVDVSEKGRWAASFDSSKISFLPDAVITPRKEADIGVVLELANKHRVPVTVRGRGRCAEAGSSTCCA